MDRYCFEQHKVTERTYITHSYHGDDTRYDDYDEYETEEILASWAIYDRRLGFNDPLAFTKDADVAQQIIDGLNRGSTDDGILT